MLKLIEPTWKIVIFEMHTACGEESSHGLCNAGTGHSGYLEPNYKNDKMLYACSSFLQSREFWATLVSKGLISNDFIQNCPHIAFGPGEAKMEKTRKDYEFKKSNPLFYNMEYTEDPKTMMDWAPLVMEGRDPAEKCCMTRTQSGTDVDFGALTKQCAEAFCKLGGDLRLFTTVTDLKQNDDKTWNVTVNRKCAGNGKRKYRTKFVYCGSGGWALKMLQKSGMKEIEEYMAFAVDGEWAVCQNPDVVNRHGVKVYAPGPVGAPPMSQPHIDARDISGKKMLLFGPWMYPTFKFLKGGSQGEMLLALRPKNIVPTITAVFANLDLVLFLVKMMLTSKQRRFAEIQEYFPGAKEEDWVFVPAAIRAQIVKPKEGSTTMGYFQFGTEVVKSEDGTMGGLMGASPGASTCVRIGLDVLENCFPHKIKEWEPKIKGIIGSYSCGQTGMGQHPNNEKGVEHVKRIIEDTARILKIRPEDRP